VSPSDLATLGADIVGQGRFVLTRLHARYGKDLKEDLVFRAAAAVAGGREMRDAAGRVETGAQAAGVNNFQARYAIRHEWTGPIECTSPVRGRWGGPPPGTQRAGPQVGKDLAFAPRGQVQLAQMVIGDVPEVEVKAAGGVEPPKPAATDTKAGAEEKKGCGCAAGGDRASFALVLLVLAMISRRKR
jgi:MYXO-CTERM domain-containing protein